MNRPIVIGFILFLVVFASFVFILRKREAEQSQPTPGTAPSEVAQKPKNEAKIERRINAKLFFSDPRTNLLIAEDRYVAYKESLHDQAAEVLRQLIAGPTKELDSTIPKGTQLRDMFITKDGIAYVDFSAELASNHIGGSDAEIETVYSIVNTLTLNFPQVKKVQILVDDRAVESLKGHLDLSHPLSQDLSVVRSGQPEAAGSKT
jgi:spore germination protein GerM